MNEREAAEAFYNVKLSYLELAKTHIQLEEEDLAHMAHKIHDMIEAYETEYMEVKYGVLDR